MPLFIRVQLEMEVFERMLRRRMLAGVTALLMGATLVFPWSAAAHNISLERSWEMAHDYARSVRDESGGKYLHYTEAQRDDGPPAHNFAGTWSLPQSNGFTVTMKLQQNSRGDITGTKHTVNSAFGFTSHR